MSSVAATRELLEEEIDPTRFRGVTAAVILPTLNEEKGLARTLEDLPFLRFKEPGQNVQALIIDGGSTDGTLEVARRWNIPFLRQTSRGKGGAMLEAIAWVHQMGIPFAVVLDADATYPADRILPALDLLRGGTDLVIGVRRPVWGPPTEFKDLIHRVGNLLLSCTATLFTHRPILDLCSGFWGVSTERFMELGLDDSGFAIEAQLILKSIRHGFSIHQIPVDYRERVGEPKLRAVRDGSRIFRAILRYARPSRQASARVRSLGLWDRDLLSIGLTLGGQGAVVQCASPEAAQAGQIAHFLQRNLPDTRVRVGTRDSPSLSRVHTRAVPALLEPFEVENLASPLSVSLPSMSLDEKVPQPATVSIRSLRQQLTIELLPQTAQKAVGPTPSFWSRSGGRRLTSLPVLAQFPSLLVLASRLNFKPEVRQRALLSANGYHVVEKAPEGRDPLPRPPLEVFSTTN
ncbi:MAG: glycosyltransferase family 2 protein [Thermoplasmata archaeon]